MLDNACKNGIILFDFKWIKEKDYDFSKPVFALHEDDITSIWTDSINGMAKIIFGGQMASGPRRVAEAIKSGEVIRGYTFVLDNDNNNFKNINYQNRTLRLGV